MPWVESLTDPQELRRCIRDLVALSTLPSIWTSYNPQQIADSKRQPIPELVEIVRKISLKVRNRLSVCSSRSLVGLHLLEGFPDLPFGDVERLRLVHGLLPLPDGFSWPVASAEQRSPFGPAPLQSLRLYYELLRPCAPHRYCDPRGLSRLRSLPLHRRTGSHVPYKSLVELRAAYMPDAARAGFRVPPS
jgi:hypothetical protein